VVSEIAFAPDLPVDEVADHVLSDTAKVCTIVQTLGNAELRDDYSGVTRASETPESPLERIDLRDDIANADRFARDNEARPRHVATMGTPWHVWDGRRWARDETNAHLEYAKLTADALWLERKNDPDKDWRKHASSTRSAGRVRGMVGLAESDRRLARRASDFDRDPWLLNVANGTVDLSTGELRPHNPADNITMLAGGAYRPDTTARTWEAFLTRILDGDQELEAFLRRLAGASAIGAVREHILVILHGNGANGKTTFVGALQAALADYAHAAPVSLLVGEHKGGATPELADLRGRRLVTVAETREDGDLSVERVKALTGGDPINARHLYGQPFTFTPSHTPWLLTNHKPRIGDDGDAIWRRLLLVPFAVTIPKAEQDAGLGDRLALEVDGILTWIIKGAIEYGERGLDPPEQVLVATNEYRDAESTFDAWIEERLHLDRDAWTSSAHLRYSYLDWAKANDAEELKARAISERLAQREGLRRARGAGGVRGWRGIRVNREKTT